MSLDTLPALSTTSAATSNPSPPSPLHAFKYSSSSADGSGGDAVTTLRSQLAVDMAMLMGVAGCCRRTRKGEEGWREKEEERRREEGWAGDGAGDRPWRRGAEVKGEGPGEEGGRREVEEGRKGESRASALRCSEGGKGEVGVGDSSGKGTPELGRTLCWNSNCASWMDVRWCER